MPNRTVTVRYILDASGYRSGANDISAADARIAATARASAAAMGQTQQKAERAQQNATRAYVAGGRAQETAIKRVSAATTSQARIIEDAERRKLRVQQDSARRIVRVQQDAARRIAQVQSESARQQIAQTAAIRQARIREDAASRASRIGIDAGVRASRAGGDDTRSLATRAAAYQQVGRTAAVTGGVLAAALALSGRAAVQWQSDFAGVTKTVDFSNRAFGTATEQQSRLEGQLRGLARTMPETHTEIAAVAEAAGQLGIATPNVAAFTKTMIQLGDTTNLSSDEAATSIAQLGNIMGTLKGPADQVNDNISRIGATIVGLGNNGASTERDITQMGLRIASAGRTIGLNTGQVLGFASAIASTGVEVEAGGTAFSNFALKVDAAVRDGGPKLDLLARTAGQSSKQFKQSYQKDAAGALTDFVEGLQRAADQGQDTNRILKQLGITGIREADTVRRLALSGSLLRDSLSDQARFYKENNALSNEAAKRYQTEASRIQIAQNKIKDDAITAGAAILPVLAQVTDGVGKVADKFASLSPETQGFAVKAAGIAGGILLIGGGALSAVGSVASLASNLKDLGATAPQIKGVAAAVGAVALAYAAAQAAGQVQDTYGSAKKQSDNQDLVTASLYRYADAAKTGAQASLDLSAAFPEPNKTDAFFASIGQDSIGVRNFSDALRYSAKSGSASLFGYGLAFQGFIDKIRPGQQQSERVADAVSKVDQSLADMVKSGNADAAAANFRKITTDAGVDPTKVADQFGAYRKALVETAGAASKAGLTQEELASLMQGQVAPAFKSIAQAQAEMTAQAAQQDKALNGGVSALSKYVEAQRNGGNTAVLSAKSSQALAQALFSESQATIAASNARVAYSQAAQAAAQQAKKSNAGIGSGVGLGKLNAEQQQNVSLLNQQAQAFQAVAQNMVVTGKSANQVAAATKTARGQFIANATAMGASKKEAANLADSYGLIPKKVRTDIEAKVSASAQTELTNFKNLVGDFPPEIKTKIQTLVEEGNYKGALAKLKEFQKKRKAEVDVKANKGSADRDLNQIANKKRKATIDAEAKTGGANSDLNSAANKKRTATIIGKATTGAANAALGKTARGRKSTITANANTGAANSAINSAARPRSTTITVNAVISGASAAIAAAKSAFGATGGTFTRFGVTGRGQGPEPIRRSNGGSVWGAGTATSDSIPAMLSDGEEVIRAKQAILNRQQLKKINSGGKWDVVPRYATGGTVGIPTFASGGRVSPTSLTAVMRYLSVLPDFFAELKRAVSEGTKGLKAVRKEERDVARAKAARRKAKTKPQKKKADREVEKQTKELTAAQKKYKTQLAAVTDAQKAAAEQIRSYGDGLTKNYRSVSTSGFDLLTLQQQGTGDLTALKKRLDALRKAGLGDSEIARIAARATDGDVAGATALADSILSGGKGLIDQLNRSNKALEKIADALAAGVVTKKTRGLAGGGQVGGGGGPTADDVPIMASSREWVHPVKSVDYYGEAFMSAIQNRTLPRQRVYGHMAGGGQVGVKVVSAPGNASDFIRALQGATFMIQNPWGPGFMEARVAGIADNRIQAAFTNAGGAR